MMDHNRVEKSKSEQLPMFILDVLQHDVAERLDSILRLLNNDSCIGWRKFWPHDFNEQEVTLALASLVEKGFVTIYKVAPDRAELIATNLRELPDDVLVHWFGRSTAGIRAWDAWNPPICE